MKLNRRKKMEHFDDYGFVETQKGEYVCGKITILDWMVTVEMDGIKRILNLQFIRQIIPSSENQCHQYVKEQNARKTRIPICSCGALMLRPRGDDGGHYDFLKSDGLWVCPRAGFFGIGHKIKSWNDD